MITTIVHDSTKQKRSHHVLAAGHKRIKFDVSKKTQDLFVARVKNLQDIARKHTKLRSIADRNVPKNSYKRLKKAARCGVDAKKKLFSGLGSRNCTKIDIV